MSCRWRVVGIHNSGRVCVVTECESGQTAADLRDLLLSYQDFLSVFVERVGPVAADAYLAAWRPAWPAGSPTALFSTNLPNPSVQSA